MSRYLIDSEYYGEAASFDSLDEAERCIRGCGGDFEATRLTERLGNIYDEEGREVGRVLEDGEKGNS